MTFDKPQPALKEADLSIWLEKAMTASARGDYGEAFECYTQALEYSGLTQDQKIGIGQFLLSTAQPWRAVEVLKSIKSGPENDQNTMALLAKALLGVGKYSESFRLYEKLYKQTRDQDVHFQMIVVAALGKKYRTLFKLINDQPALYQAIIEYLYSINMLEPAEVVSKKTTTLWPDEADTWNYLGVVQAGRDLADDALKAFRRAFALSPNNPDIQFNLGNTLGSLGEIDEAVAHYRGALKVSPKNINVLRNLAEYVKFKGDEAELQILKDLSKQADLQDKDQASVLYALGKAYDDLKQYNDAMACYLKGGRIKAQNRPYKVDAEIELLSRIRDLFENMTPHETAQSSAKPVFIVGLPRSGTTLVEQILAAHPDVHGAGELSYLRDVILENYDGRNAFHTPSVWEFLGKSALPSSDIEAKIAKDYVEKITKLSPKARRVVDKQPLNDRYLGFAAMALPNATFIHCVRDLRDTCLSCLSKNFDGEFGFTDTMENIAAYAKAQREHMAYWEKMFPGRIHTVAYEDVVEDIETQARRLVDTIGLDWSDDCLNYNRASRSVKTASAWQVRKEIYGSSIKRWERYLPTIKPLIDALE